MTTPQAEPIAILLRGINVGGKNRLPMADLRHLLSDAGYGEVSTYIQSGNVVCMPPSTPPVDMAAHVSEAVTAATGLTVPVVVRTASAVRAVVRRCPFDPGSHEPKLLHAWFLSSAPASHAAAALDPDRSPGDEFRLVGSELWVYYADGQARTKLTIDYIERTLGVTATARNWNTVVRLDAMLHALTP